MKRFLCLGVTLCLTCAPLVAQEQTPTRQETCTAAPIELQSEGKTWGVVIVKGQAQLNAEKLAVQHQGHRQPVVSLEIPREQLNLQAKHIRYVGKKHIEMSGRAQIGLKKQLPLLVAEEVTIYLTPLDQQQNLKQVA